jgi:hypothetical protein
LNGPTHTASVNLGTTGSSFHKASDRLFGTLLAAAYAMLVADLFPGSNDYVKIVSIGVFTYIVIYLINSDHAYKHTYAATSIGSMLYGSVQIDFDIAGYIPKRIELIFVGVVIFTLVELFLFPRSSRKIVEGLTFQFFLSVRDFLVQGKKCCEKMNDYVIETEAHETTPYTKLVFEKLDDPFDLKQLGNKHDKMKKQLAKIKNELDDAIVEPDVGLALPIFPEAFRCLVGNQQNCELQAAMFLNALQQLSKYYLRDGHPIREMSWPSIHTGFLTEASESTEICCKWLMSIFPDGRIRAQGGNSVKAVAAASSFRTLEDVRLKIIADWSDAYEDFLALEGFEKSDPVTVMTLGNTTSVILELLRSYQKAGKNLEEIAYRFPASK